MKKKLIITQFEARLLPSETMLVMNPEAADSSPLVAVSINQSITSKTLNITANIVGGRQIYDDDYRGRYKMMDINMTLSKFGRKLVSLGTRDEFGLNEYKVKHLRMCPYSDLADDIDALVAKHRGKLPNKSHENEFTNTLTNLSVDLRDEAK